MAEAEDQWRFNVYRHPKRQGTSIAARFTMPHDVYSLGAVLLGIGPWRPLEKYENELKGKTPRDMRDELLKLVGGVAIQLGCKYRDLVIWCLSLDYGDLGMKSYVEHVQEKLEELVL